MPNLNPPLSPLKGLFKKKPVRIGTVLVGIENSHPSSLFLDLDHKEWVK